MIGHQDDPQEVHRCISCRPPLPDECAISCCKDQGRFEGSKWSPLVKLLLLHVAFLEAPTEVAVWCWLLAPTWRYAFCSQLGYCPRHTPPGFRLRFRDSARLSGRREGLSGGVGYWRKEQENEFKTKVWMGLIKIMPEYDLNYRKATKKSFLRQEVMLSFLSFYTWEDTWKGLYTG